MFVVAFAALVVVADYAVAIANKYQTILEWVFGGRHGFGYTPDDQFDDASGVATLLAIK